MNHISITLFCLCLFFNSQGQIGSEVTWPPKTLRPDTITVYLFGNNTLLTKEVTNTRALSNFSFQARDFQILWMPVNSSNINDFITRSLHTFRKVKISDTLHCEIFGYAYSSILLKSRNRNMMLMYQNKNGYQDVFLVTGFKKGKASQILNYINRYFKK